MKIRLRFKPLMALSLVVPVAMPFSQVHAAAVFIKNSSFEQDRLSDGGYIITTSPSGWSSGGNAGWQNPTSAIFQTVPDGVQTGFIGGGGGPSRGAMSQILGEGVVANSRYTLSVDVGRRPDILLDDFVVELFSGGTLLTSGSFTNADIAAGEFKNLVLTYDSTAALTDPLRILFRATGTSSDYRQVNFDNIKLDYVTTAVPEPASWAMMIVGIGMTGSMLRRRKADRSFAPNAVA